MSAYNRNFPPMRSSPFKKAGPKDATSCTKKHCTFGASCKPPGGRVCTFCHCQFDASTPLPQETTKCPFGKKCTHAKLGCRKVHSEEELQSMYDDCVEQMRTKIGTTDFTIRTFCGDVCRAGTTENCSRYFTGSGQSGDPALGKSRPGCHRLHLDQPIFGKHPVEGIYKQLGLSTEVSEFYAAPNTWLSQQAANAGKAEGLAEKVKNADVAREQAEQTANDSRTAREQAEQKANDALAAREQAEKKAKDAHATAAKLDSDLQGAVANFNIATSRLRVAEATLFQLGYIKTPHRHYCHFCSLGNCDNVRCQCRACNPQ
jgi:hypothetical protein